MNKGSRWKYTRECDGVIRSMHNFFWHIRFEEVIVVTWTIIMILLTLEINASCILPRVYNTFVLCYKKRDISSRTRVWHKKRRKVAPILQQPFFSAFFLSTVLGWRQETQNKIKKKRRSLLEEKKEEKKLLVTTMFDRKIVQT